MALSIQAKSLWGKTNQTDCTQWLPLYVHLVDSLNMAAKLWDQWVPQGTRDMFARNMHGDVTLARKVCLLLAGLHDIGKATPVFQSKPVNHTLNQSMAWMPESHGLPMPAGLADHGKPTHTVAGQAIMETHLKKLGWAKGIRQSYASIIGAHHGTPPTAEAVREARSAYPQRMGWSPELEPQWRAAQNELIAMIVKLSGLSDDDLAVLSATMLEPQSESLLCGIVIMADWMASNSEPDMFPLVPVNGALAPADPYGIQTVSALSSRADRAWRNLGFPSPWAAEQPETSKTSDDLENWFSQRFQLPAHATIRPVQKEAVRLAMTTPHPGLMLIEAPMGEGKTEAALAAAELLAGRSHRGGVCLALPTMATTDAMYHRVQQWLDRLPGEGKTVWLAHGKAMLNREFRKLMALSRKMSPMGQDEPGSPDAPVVSDWMAGRKRGVLSNFLICTIDQVLMGALEMKHVSLRQLGLSNKVVIIDECHAYDTYMQQYLERVLEWLAGCGTPVILLSATLPERLRGDLVNAYIRGKGGSPLQIPESDAYPRITCTSGTTVHTTNVAPSSRRISVRCGLMSDDDSALCGLLDDKLSDGGCAGIICDTVGRAQHAAQILSERYGDHVVKLIHSRFIGRDRMDREKRLRTMLGPAATRENGIRPEKLIVVGTQVLEQSLDIDFDLLVTDAAPADLIMQRIGRLHRHDRATRPNGVSEPSCLIRGIEWKDGAPVINRSILSVYHEGASILEMLAAMSLVQPQAETTLDLPSDIAGTVHTAYSPRQVKELLPGEWESQYATQTTRRTDKASKQRLRARTHLMKSLAEMIQDDDTLTGWFEHAPLDDKTDAKGQMSVRDTPDTVDVIIAESDGESLRLLPWVGEPKYGIPNGAQIPVDEAPDTRMALLLNQCALRLPVSLSDPHEGIDPLIKELESRCAHLVDSWQENTLLQGQLVLALRADQSEFRTKLQGFALSYDKERGLICAKS